MCELLLFLLHKKPNKIKENIYNRKKTSAREWVFSSFYFVFMRENKNTFTFYLLEEEKNIYSILWQYLDWKSRLKIGEWRVGDGILIYIVNKWIKNVYV